MISQAVKLSIYFTLRSWDLGAGCEIPTEGHPDIHLYLGPVNLEIGLLRSRTDD